MTGELKMLLSAINGVIAAGVVLKCVLIFQNGRASDKSLQEILQKIGKVVYAGIIAISITSFCNWADSKLVVLQGTSDVQGMSRVIAEFIRIIKDTLVLISGSITVWKLCTELLFYQFGDEQDKVTHLKGAKKQLAIGIGIVVIGGLITVVLGYFS